MTATIDFYFDFTSPYGYLASRRIEAIAARHEHTVAWHPILLGAIFRHTEQQPLIGIPLKGDYARHDLARAAREHAIPYRLPDPFPIATVPAARAVHWCAEHDDGAEHHRVPELVHALYEALFVENLPIGKAETVVDVAKALKLPASRLADALADDALKQRLRQAIDDAVARGVFGSPMMYVDDEPFWGHDHLEQLDRWLERGGW